MLQFSVSLIIMRFKYKKILMITYFISYTFSEWRYIFKYFEKTFLETHIKILFNSNFIMRSSGKKSYSDSTKRNITCLPEFYCAV